MQIEPKSSLQITIIIPLLTVLHCNIYHALTVQQVCSSSGINQNCQHCITACLTASESIQQSPGWSVGHIHECPRINQKHSPRCNAQN